MSIISLEHVNKKKEEEKKWSTYDLLDIINNRTKFQLNQIRT